MTSMGLAIKNGILFALIILIVHVALLKTEAEADAEAETKTNLPMPMPLPHDPPPHPLPPLAATAGVIDDPTLLNYVFGDTRSPSVKSDMSVKKESVNMGKGMSSYMVVGAYTNENELCGGSVLKSPTKDDVVLSGFDGFHGSYDEIHST